MMRPRDLSPRITGRMWCADLQDPRRCRWCGISGGGWVFGAWSSDGSTLLEEAPHVCLACGCVCSLDERAVYTCLHSKAALALLRRRAGWPRERWWAGFVCDPLRGLPVDRDGTYWRPPTTSSISPWSST